MVGLSDPLEVGDFTFKNRIVLPPMQTRLANSDGAVTAAIKRHYAERAGGVGLAIVEHSYVSDEGKYCKNQLGVHKDELIPGLRELAKSIREEGTPATIQINHAGKRVEDRDVDSKPVAPSSSESARKLEVSEIGEIVGNFGDAAKRAIRAGFDAVEIHGAHGFLLNQFYSPLANRRSDAYGGSFEKRVKFPLQIVEKVRKQIGENLLLYRLGSDDLDREGIRAEDSRKFAMMLEERGVDIIDVSGGLCGSRPDSLREEQGYFIPQAREIKGAVNIPVIGVGGITEPEYADKIIQEGSVDLVAVGRAQLSDPRWAVKALNELGEK